MSDREPVRRRGIIGCLVDVYRWSGKFPDIRLALLGVCLMLMPIAPVLIGFAYVDAVEAGHPMPKWVYQHATIHFYGSLVGALVGILLVLFAAGRALRNQIRWESEQRQN